MRAAIFDMDGLLIDSEPLWRRAEIAVFETVGIALDEKMCRQTTGMRIDAAIQHWFERFPWQGKSTQQLTHELLLRVQGEVEETGVCMPGVVETLDNAQAAGWRIGLASSSPSSLITCVLQKLGIADYFDVCCSAVDEPAGKPDPAVYLTVARVLEVAPGRCVAFEDSLPGIRSAKAAGMQVVAVPDPARSDDPAFAMADLRLRSLQELSYQTLIGL
ncbi:MAG: hexitol phosphatase HxpB [Gammaproteobacteria bacterium]|nr:hexitol phosphatase HxpB [Gammaproteobacteria bacterium]